jgi:5-methylcytosine-specific restriction endonuclease McrA
MRRLPVPTDTCIATFRTCVARVGDAGRKARLTSVESDIVRKAADYVAAAHVAALHTFPQATGVAHIVSDVELQNLYSRQLVIQETPARLVYDRLLSAAPSGTCPLCGEQTAKTLDHHLPKGRFAALSVTPCNLVPACRDCQSAKLEKFPTTAGEQTLHPYFDDLQTERWLIGSVIQGAPAAIAFDFVSPPGWSAVKQERYRRHLTVFDLRSRFSLFAARELVNIRWQLGRLHVAGGAVAVRRHLEDTADSRRAAWLNSWQTAMYEACAASNWFCDTGFALG